jgi:hypothetical protein
MPRVCFPRRRQMVFLYHIYADSSKENPDHSLFEQNRSGLSSSDPEAQGVEAAPGGGALRLSTQRPGKQSTIRADLSRSNSVSREIDRTETASLSLYVLTAANLNRLICAASVPAMPRFR